MRKYIIFYRYIKVFLLIFVLISIGLFYSCSHSQQIWSVYSIEVLFNNESKFDFCAQIGESFDVSITVNDYKETYKFSRFFAWIDYKDEKLELKYGNNQVCLNEAGHYQVKVTIIDGYGYLMTKRMPFDVIGPVDNEPPQILGEINNIPDNRLMAYSNIGLVLPRFEIIDNVDTELDLEIQCDGKINYDDFFDVLYYIHEKEKDDQLIIKVRDSSGNTTELTIDIKHKSIYEKLYNWFINPDYQNYDDIYLNENELFYKGNDTFVINYEPSYEKFNMGLNIALDFKQYNANSNLKLKFNYDFSKYYIIEFDYNQNMIIFDDTSFIMPEDLAFFNIRFDATSIKISNINNDEAYNFNFESIQDVSAITFEMTNLYFSAQINP